MPAWRCYGRLWEKLAASFLTLFILATLLGIGHRHRARGRLELRPLRIGSALRPAFTPVNGRKAPCPEAGRRYDRGMSVSHEPAGAAGALTAEPRSFLDALGEVSEAVEAGAGLPSVARAAGRAHRRERDRARLAEQRAGGGLRVAGGRARGDGARGRRPERRAHGRRGGGRASFATACAAAEPVPSLLRVVANLIGLEVDRAKAPERASEAAVADFVNDLLARRIPDGETVAARAAELGCDLVGGSERDRRPCPAAAPGGGRLARACAHGRRARRPRG